MITGWTSKRWEEIWINNGDLWINKKRGNRSDWSKEGWPPIKLVVMTQEEYDQINQINEKK